MGPLTTFYDGEIEAIAVTIQQLLVRSHSFTRAVILSVSKGALQVFLNNQKSSQTILECRSFLKALTQRISIHCCGILGNARADALAKRGALIDQRTHDSPSFISYN